MQSQVLSFVRTSKFHCTACLLNFEHRTLNSILLNLSSGKRYYSSNTKKLVDRIIRVDHAGELGADRIYAGQLAVLGKYGKGLIFVYF